MKSGKAKGDNWLKPTQFQMIFSNIDPIYTMSCTFLKELEKCYADWILSERTADGNHSRFVMTLYKKCVCLAQFIVFDCMCGRGKSLCDCWYSRGRKRRSC